MNIDAPAHIENRAINPEKSASARHIYQGLRENVGKATLFGFHQGNVYLHAQPGRQRELQISRVHTNLGDDVYKLYGTMGFSRKDIASGIISVWEVEGPSTESLTFTNRNALSRRILYVSGTGKVLEKDQPEQNGLDSPRVIEYDRFHTTKLDGYIRDGIQRLAFLSSVPHAILDTFGTYDQFKEALGTADMTGIETKGDLNALHNQVVYYFGDTGRLKEYVESLAQARKGVYSEESNSPFHFITRKGFELGDFKTFYDTLRNSTYRQNGILKWISQRVKFVQHAQK